ncbi:hypothetical protein [Klebsiella pneumoniae]|uniref:hypothetical protein n=1 Tax=Klebsiella pneumoniae TaxID=573 RepID=UPI002E2EBD1C|nr:hypothetical protein [Klebsiella pneumoniae]
MRLSRKLRIRIADVNAKAAQAADELLAATQGIEASIESLTQVMKSADENLAREMSSLAAGANIQFDSQVIWHFNNQTTEGCTGSAGVPGVSQDGRLRPADSATDPYITSPGGLAVDGAAYRFITLRFRKTGKPVWRVRSVGCLPAKTSITRSDTLLLSQNMPMGWQP